MSNFRSQLPSRSSSPDATSAVSALGAHLQSAAPYLLTWVGLLSAVVGISLGGWALALPVAVLYITMPVVDHLVGINRSNPHPDAPPKAAPLHDWLLWSFVPAQVVFITWGIGVVIHGEASLVEQVATVVNIGLIAGSFGITVAHELMHRTSRFERGLAEILMGSVTYTWFCIEHVYGHHRHVATPQDPASSRQGESLFAFLPRTLVGTVQSAWRIEDQRRKKLGISAFSPHNRMLRCAVGLVLMYGVTFGAFGWIGVAVVAAQSAVAVLMLEIINYIEHYGLQRKRLANGRFERVQPRHSWNASHKISNWMLINLARHSDHHAYAARPFYALRHHEDVPQMPSGYGAMFLLALVPPLWFAVMDPLADRWNAAEG